MNWSEIKEFRQDTSHCTSQFPPAYEKEASVGVLLKNRLSYFVYCISFWNWGYQQFFETDWLHGLILQFSVAVPISLCTIIHHSMKFNSKKNKSGSMILICWTQSRLLAVVPDGSCICKYLFKAWRILEGGHKLRLRDEGARNGWPNCFSEQTMNFHEFTIRLKSRSKITDFYSGKGIIASDWIISV